MSQERLPVVPPDPLRRFAELFDRALHSDIVEPTAMTLATAGVDGRPSARVVLLKGFDERGFVFYTNLESRKGEEIRENPFAALCFWWPPLEMQVRIEGRVEQVSDEEADLYFASRPRGSRIGAWASLQSAPLASRTELEERIREIEKRFAGQEIPRPPFWSGFRVVPERIEFWRNKLDRLHERDVYTPDPEARDGWRVEHLFP